VESESISMEINNPRNMEVLKEFTLNNCNFTEKKINNLKKELTITSESTSNSKKVLNYL